jgi:hypothetical protein
VDEIDGKDEEEMYRVDPKEKIFLVFQGFYTHRE